jgi:excisionase family DNA binding protein
MTDKQKIEPRLLTFKEAQAYLGLGRSVLYKLTNSGTVPAIKVTERKWSYDKQELDAWIEQQKQQQRKVA